MEPKVTNKATNLPRPPKSRAENNRYGISCISIRILYCIIVFRMFAEKFLVCGLVSLRKGQEPDAKRLKTDPPKAKPQHNNTKEVGNKMIELDFLSSDEEN